MSSQGQYDSASPVGRTSAVIWDYDGTLVDTRHRNLNVTRAIIEKVTGSAWETFSALRSLENYARAITVSVNWRSFYRHEFSMSDQEIDDAGSLWTDFQMRDSTPISVFQGIHNVLHQLRDIPHGIVSQGSRTAIMHVLEGNNLRQYFDAIVGFEEVEIRKQKPEPGGLLRCIDELPLSAGGTILSIGDHETDAVCARNADQVLRQNGSHLRVRSIAARYSIPGDGAEWRIPSDFEAETVEDILRIVESISTVAIVRP